MKKIYFSIKHSYQKNDGTREVKLVFYFNRQPVRLSTEVYVNHNSWNEEDQIVKKSDPDHADKNLQLENCRSRLTEIRKKYRLEWKELTLNRLKAEYRIFSSHTDFYAFMQREINIERQHVEKATIVKRQAALNKLKRYRHSLFFSELDENFLKGFERHMRVKLHNNRNTRSKTMEIFRRYVRIALRKNIIDQDPFLYYKITTEKTDIIYLERKELQKLMQLYKKDILNHTQQRALRRFLFCCHTGLRISDVESLRGEDISNGYLSKVAYKTRNQKSKHLEIPLTPFAQQLIHHENPRPTKGYLFTDLHRATVSKHIKLIAKEKGINKEISTKTGRHTFATLFLENGGALEVLQRLLGHSNIRETMVYVHVSKERVADQMQQFAQYV